MGRVAGKVAIVTGAASGLGAADAAYLAREGATVVMTDVNETDGRKLAAGIERAVFLPHDVRSEADWRRVMDETLSRFGRLDVMVNNAGIVRFKTIEETTLDDLRFTNAVMVEGTFLGCQHALKAMREKGGSIINVSSVAAVMSVPPVFAYAAAKGAIISMTRNVAGYCKEARLPVRCNVVLPGMITTPMTAAGAANAAEAGTSAAVNDEVYPMGEPGDIANAVLYLASDESRFVNGAEFRIDDALTLGHF